MVHITIYKFHNFYLILAPIKLMFKLYTLLSIMDNYLQTYII